MLEPTVSFLADLAGDGAALELGDRYRACRAAVHVAGSARHGIDLSPAMVAELQAKPGADAIAVTIGDIAHHGRRLVSGSRTSSTTRSRT